MPVSRAAEMPDLVADPTCSCADGNQLEKMEQTEDHTGKDPRSGSYRDERRNCEHHRSPETATVSRTGSRRRVNDLGSDRRPRDVWWRLLILRANLGGSGRRCRLGARSQRAADQTIRRGESVDTCRCHSRLPSWRVARSISGHRPLCPDPARRPNIPGAGRTFAPATLGVRFASGCEFCTSDARIHAQTLKSTPGRTSRDRSAHRSATETSVR